MPYMAPEQIEGREVDARSDIFSLGAVIYEMVTGQRAFKGDSPASVIGAILKDEPAPMKTLQPLTPAALDHVVSDCLAKDPDERWQSAADIARELKWVARAASCRLAAPRRRSRCVAGADRRRVIVALGVTAWPALRPSSPRRHRSVSRWTLRLMPRFVQRRSSVPIIQVALSPNGRHMAFVAAESGKRSR